MTIWNLSELAKRGEPDVFAAFRTPLRSLGPTPATVSVAGFTPQGDPQSFPMPTDTRRTTWPPRSR